MRDLYIGGYLLYFYKDHSRHIGVERIDQQYKLLLWFVKGKRERTGHNIFDRIDSLRAKKDLFEWEQHTAEPEYVISRLTG